MEVLEDRFLLATDPTRGTWQSLPLPDVSGAVDQSSLADATPPPQADNSDPTTLWEINVEVGDEIGPFLGSAAAIVPEMNSLHSTLLTAQVLPQQTEAAILGHLDPGGAPGMYRLPLDPGDPLIGISFSWVNPLGGGAGGLMILDYSAHILCTQKLPRDHLSIKLQFSHIGTAPGTALYVKITPSLIDPAPPTAEYLLRVMKGSDGLPWGVIPQSGSSDAVPPPKQPDNSPSPGSGDPTAWLAEGTYLDFPTALPPTSRGRMPDLNPSGSDLQFDPTPRVVLPLPFAPPLPVGGIFTPSDAVAPNDGVVDVGVIDVVTDPNLLDLFSPRVSSSRAAEREARKLARGVERFGSPDLASSASKADSSEELAGNLGPDLAAAPVIGSAAAVLDGWAANLLSSAAQGPAGDQTEVLSILAVLPLPVDVPRLDHALQGGEGDGSEPDRAALPDLAAESGVGRPAVADLPPETVPGEAAETADGATRGSIARTVLFGLYGSASLIVGLTAPNLTSAFRDQRMRWRVAR